MTVRTFGTFEGKDVLAIDIASRQARMTVLTWGAVVQSWQTDDGQPIVLGFEKFSDYATRSGHFGAVAGRFANRIRNGQFTLDGKTFQVDRNQHGVHHLHGGERGFGVQPWTLASNGEREVHLVLVSPDGDMGYPGRVVASCRYRLEDPATLVIELTAQTDAPTPINLTNHSYFNLDGSRNILDHRLTMNATSIIPVDSELIPTGSIIPVVDSPYDFRTPRRIGDGRMHYDVNYVLDRSGPGLFHAATLETQRLRLETWTTEPGVQLYDAHAIGCPGVCLEAQAFPAAPNFEAFPSAILRPGETYRHLTEYRLEAV